MKQHSNEVQALRSLTENEKMTSKWAHDKWIVRRSTE